MGDIVEYAVMVDRGGAREVDSRSITTDRKIIRQRRRRAIANEDLYARAAGLKPATVSVVMRTCTPWCEVAEKEVK